MRRPRAVAFKASLAMNFDTLTEFIQKSFRVSLGAAASAVEAVQDPQASATKFSDIGADFDRLASELEVKGELTEKEAREFVDNVSTNFNGQWPNPFGRARFQNRLVRGEHCRSRWTTRTRNQPAVLP